MRRVLLVLVLVSAAVVFAAALRPELDLSVSRAFYRPPGRFLLSHGVLPGPLRHPAVLVVLPVVIGSAGLLLAVLVRRRPVLGISGRHIALVLLSLAVGAGPLIDGLKRHFGRARPEQVEPFGGSLRFTAPLVVAAQCRINCSFPSGDAAATFALVAVGLALESPAAVAGALLVGVAVSGVRVAKGAHFLSDVVFGALLGVLAALVLQPLLLARRRGAPPPRR